MIKPIINKGNIKQAIIAIKYLVCFIPLLAMAQSSIIVDKNGGGNFTTIQAALNSLANDAASPRTIFIKNGIYNEKVFIEKNNIIFEGEDKNKTIITQSIARDIWRCDHADDWGVATLNLKGNDLTFKNLTIQNNYGFENENTIVSCNADTSALHQKKVNKDGHQMALRSFGTTRLRVINCNLIAFGGDTVSPWNLEDGMFYFKDCVIEGGVDFYCPRGWAWAENCQFVAHTGPASIWHDGSKFADAKTVLLNCDFKGYDGFLLGRYHRDAQFYLLNCHFANNMADKPIYRVPTNNVIQWGERIYYNNCHRDGGDYPWFANNLQLAKGSPTAHEIEVHWLFGDRWNPIQ